MHDSVQISCVIGTTDSTCPLGMEIWLDDICIFDTDHVCQDTRCQYTLPDIEGKHSLRFVMTGKSAEHTKIDQLGNIVKDARLTIRDIQFDEIALGQIHTDLAVYTHDFNGTGPMTRQKFYGEIGCNGTVELQFSTPVYIWLLENM